MKEISGSYLLPAVLFVDDDPNFLAEVSYVVEARGFCTFVPLTDSTRVLDELATGRYSALFMDWVMPVLTGADLLPIINSLYPSLPVVIMTGISDLDTAVHCMKQGAHDYLTKPLDSNRLLSCISNALKISELSSRNQQLTDFLLGNPIEKPENFKHIVTCSEKMFTIFKLVETVAPSRYPVFITGETGVGKELIASAVHRASGLKGKFVPINLAGLDPLLFDDTLFGHRKGAYTGASESRDGLIRQAQGGTLFLDEIGDLAQESQLKLLRLLQENEYYRLGSDLLQKSDARIVTASNREFAKLLEAGTFRGDLYHRLSYHRLHIPPLRERVEDIIPLAFHFAASAASAMHKPVPEISSELRYTLSIYDFPGNVRELENMISNAVVVNRSGVLSRDDFPDLTERRESVGRSMKDYSNGQFSLNLVFTGFPTLQQIEQILIQEALKKSLGRKGVAAELLGVSRQTLRNKIGE